MEKLIEIKLAHPVKYGDGELSVLTLRRPKAGDFRLLKGMEHPFAMILDLAAALSEVSPSVIDRLDIDDMQRVAEVVGGFLGKFPGTGTT